MNRLFVILVALLVACSSDKNSDEQQTPDSSDSILILNKSGNTAWQLNAETGTKLTEYETGTAPHEVAVSPDQSRAIITNYGAQTPGNSLTIINLESQQVDTTISIGKYERPHGVEWFSDGRRAIVTAESQQSVLTIDIDTGEILSAISTNQEVSHMVALSEDETTAYVTNLGSGSVSVLDLSSQKVTATLQTGNGTEGVTIVPDKNEVWVTNRSANTVSILDASTNESIQTLNSSNFPIRAETSPNGKWVAVSNARSGEVSIFDIENRKPLVKISTVEDNGQGMPIGLTFSDNSNRLYIANSEADNIVVLDTQNWKLINTFDTGETPDGIAYINRGE